MGDFPDAPVSVGCAGRRRERPGTVSPFTRHDRPSSTMTEQQAKRSYKATLQLPKTGFPMKANLVQNEPASVKRWQQQGVYQRLRAQREGASRYVFHDGPPYANGSIHTGHLLNKVLKDLVVRSRNMLGYDCPFIPGWDCHGLPIEHRVVEGLGDKARGMAPMQIRKRCADYATKYIKVQADGMKRLLTLADYEQPYLTMAPAYEAAVLEVFAGMVEQGVVYRGLKPVHWSIENQTALAEAELEYYEREDASIYAFFTLAGPEKVPASLGASEGEPVKLVIWTTTPWTLPANLAVAVAPQSMYALYRFTQNGRSHLALLAEALGEKVLAMGGAEAIEKLGTCTGAELVAAEPRYDHPFNEQCKPRPIVAADYVTLEEGTGLVHIAPGHGVEDYLTGLREGLDIYCPVRGDGTFDDTAVAWLHGRSVWEANDLVMERLRDTGHMFHEHRLTHSYPHDWRGKTPVIFRATEQWFVSVDQPMPAHGRSLRELAVEQAGSNVDFIPEWGRNRMVGMLESRPDWCLSRQRVWGLPIPAFYGPAGAPPLLTAASVRAVAKVIEAQGSDAWFTSEPSQLLAHYSAADDPQAPAWVREAAAAGTLTTTATKSRDIFDVWFESGSSWHAALQRMQDACPADLYLEGSDQHRGWFQLSLLPAAAVTGRAPFRSVLTHGFIVDKGGHKMSKSVGNALEVEDLLREFGADVCRWWVSSLNTDRDIKMDVEFFKVAGEEYRKVRNTIRFLLSNLRDFDAGAAALPGADEDASVDAWVLGELNGLISTARRAYETFAFRHARAAIFNFCNDTISAIYGNAVKDRLYCDAPDSRRRRRAQATIDRILGVLIRLIAPILPHTADEAWAIYHSETGRELEHESVHLDLLPEPVSVTVAADWPRVMLLREQAMKRIEQHRSEHDIDNPLDLGVRVAAPDAGDGGWLDRFDPVDFADLCAVSRAEFLPAGSAPAIEVVDLRNQPRCERSWKRDGTVKPRSDGGHLSDRDAAVVGVE